jgi:hypothetical protein
VAVSGRRDAECVAFGKRFAQEAHQRVVDARILDAGRREKILHEASLRDAAMPPSLSKKRRRDPEAVVLVMARECGPSR